jgi:hypothetical protein
VRDPYNLRAAATQNVVSSHFQLLSEWFNFVCNVIKEARERENPEVTKCQLKARSEG